MRSFLARWGVWLAAAALLGVAAVGLLAGARHATDRTYRLEQRLRCPTCQSVSIADSPSDTAAAMRASVEQQVAAGRDDQEILNYFQARYGAWVLLEPPVRGATLLVWVLPLLALAAGAAVLAALLRRPPPVPPLDEAQRARVHFEARRLGAQAGEENP